MMTTFNNNNYYRHFTSGVPIEAVSPSSSSSSSSIRSKSKSIPIHGASPSSSSFYPPKRTPSEEQLHFDQVLADNRDYQFCCRIVQGIAKTIELRNSSTSTSTTADQDQLQDQEQVQQQQSPFYTVNRACLDHIISTRNTNVDDNTASSRSAHDYYYDDGHHISAITPSPTTSSQSRGLLPYAGGDIDDDDDWAMGHCDIDETADDDGDDDYGHYSLNRNDPMTTSAINWLNQNCSGSSANAATIIMDQPSSYSLEEQQQQQRSSYHTSSCYCYEDDIIFDMED